MQIFTIGFSQKNASQFFGLLKRPGVTKLIDARLNNVSQLAGFTKKNDLPFFLKEICNLPYLHIPNLAPNDVLLEAYKNDKNWNSYEVNFNNLMATRKVELMDKQIISGACILCSEPKADKCHRRLVAEYFRDKWGNIEIIHL